MKKGDFIIFFVTFFTVYGFTNLYIFIRGWQSLQYLPGLRNYYLAGFLILSLSFIAGRFLERIWLSLLSDTLVWIGSFWLAAMLYFILFLLIIDLARLINHFAPFIHHLSADYVRLKFITAVAVIGITGLILLVGFINAYMPRIKTMELHIDKACSYDSIKVAVASDIHLGTIVGRKRFCNIVNKINQLQPDLVLLPGDIIDEDLAPVIKKNLGEAITSIKPALGVYAVTGNHEYIGGVKAAYQYLMNHKITVLRDSTVQIKNCLYIVGREDRSISQFTGKKRKTLETLMTNVDKSRPIILMDHQPFHLREAVEYGVDLQLSGHTHHGQLWPLNFITRAIYQISWGYGKIADTHFYVSSGAGTWGPPIRIGNYPEIVQIILRFRHQQDNID